LSSLTVVEVIYNQKESVLPVKKIDVFYYVQRKFGFFILHNQNVIHRAGQKI